MVSDSPMKFSLWWLEPSWLWARMTKGQIVSMTDLAQNSGRGERIRTSGLYVPNVALYQAKLHPDLGVQCSFCEWLV